MQEDIDSHSVKFSAISHDPLTLSNHPFPFYTSKRYRILFHSHLVDKESPNIGGFLIFERRASEDSSWPTEKDWTRGDVQAGQYAVFELHSDELLAFYSHISALLELHPVAIRKGSFFGVDKYMSRSDLATILKKNVDLSKHPQLCEIVCELLSDPDPDQVIARHVLSSDSIPTTIANYISSLSSSELSEFIDKLKHVTVDSLQNALNIQDLENLKNEIDIRMNRKEDDWKEILSDHHLVLSQLFIHPFVVFKTQAKTGGGGLDSIGGICDYIVKNKVSDNITFLEIKNPNTPLVNQQPYRDGDNVYPVSSHLSGAIVQVNSYRDNLLKEYSIRAKNTVETFQAINPMCVVIAGNLSLLSEEQRRSFELFRNSLAGTSVITFDELRNRIQLVIDLLKSVDGSKTVNIPVENTEQIQ